MKFLTSTKKASKMDLLPLESKQPNLGVSSRLVLKSTLKEQGDSDLTGCLVLTSKLLTVNNCHAACESKFFTEKARLSHVDLLKK